MKVPVKTVLGFWMVITALAVLAHPGLSQENVIRAKVGILIKSGEQVARAKARDRLKAGDMVRVYVHPEEDSFIYVVHTDRKTVTLLNQGKLKLRNSTLLLPSVQEYYQVDGQSPTETFTIICSRQEQKEVAALLKSPMPYDRWVSLEKELQKKGEIDLAGKPEKPFAIAGNVRGAGDAVGGDPFLKELQIFSGRSVLVKPYEFSVKK